MGKGCWCLRSGQGLGQVLLLQGLQGRRAGLLQTLLKLEQGLVQDLLQVGGGPASDPALTWGRSCLRPCLDLQEVLPQTLLRPGAGTCCRSGQGLPQDLPRVGAGSVPGPAPGRGRSCSRLCCELARPAASPGRLWHTQRMNQISGIKQSRWMKLIVAQKCGLKPPFYTRRG